jgi:hypothetical protein
MAVVGTGVVGTAAAGADPASFVGGPAYYAVMVTVAATSAIGSHCLGPALAPDQQLLLIEIAGSGVRKAPAPLAAGVFA